MLLQLMINLVTGNLTEIAGSKNKMSFLSSIPIPTRTSFVLHLQEIRSIPKQEEGARLAVATDDQPLDGKSD